MITRAIFRIGIFGNGIPDASNHLLSGSLAFEKPGMEQNTAIDIHHFDNGFVAIGA